MRFKITQGRLSMRLALTTRSSFLRKIFSITYSVMAGAAEMPGESMPIKLIKSSTSFASSITKSYSRWDDLKPE